MATNVYVDGFNLYFGCLKGTPYRWLDLAELCRVLLPRDDIHRIRYFTARVVDRPHDQNQAMRQQSYLRALRTIPNLIIHEGHFLSHTVRMRLANPPRRGLSTVEVIKTEEKGSDVNLATYLLLDSFRQEMDTAVVISNDSDLAEPIRVARAELGMKVGVINPRPTFRRSRELQGDFFKQIRPTALRRSQFPLVLHDAEGTIHSPAEWLMNHQANSHVQKRKQSNRRKRVRQLPPI